MIGRSVGRFRVLSKLGEGGMGSVWRAEDLLLERMVALKFLAEALSSAPEARQRFLREARSASRLSHPGIATVFEAGESDDVVYIAMQLVEGSSLSERLSSGPLSIEESVRIGAEAAEALAHAHEHGVLHRDVTSRNIMLARDGHVVVVDFGLALAEGGTRLTETGTMMGTVAYMAPEVVKGKHADARSDLYGLGVVHYEMLTGRPPFTSERREALLYAAVHERPRPLRSLRPQVPESLDRVVLKLLAKDPSQRHRSAVELVGDLKAVQRGAVPPSLAAEPKRRGRTSAQARGASPRMRAAADETTAETARVATVSPPLPAAPAPSRPSRKRHLWALVLAVSLMASVALVITVLRKADGPMRAGGTGGQLRVAVLPLRSLGSDPTQGDHIAMGIAEHLTTKLTLLGDLQVQPWFTTQRYTDPSRPLEDIAAELRADVLVVGSLRAFENRIQGSVALVDATTGDQYWAEQFDELWANIFQLQGRIAMAVAAKLTGDLSGATLAELEKAVSRSAEAYDYYLRGKEEMRAGGEVATSRALGFFDNAVSLDPELAEAHVGIGAVHSDRYYFGWGGGARNLELAEASHLRAMELNPRLIPALSGLIRVYWETGRFDECLKVGQEVLKSGREGVEALFVRGEAYLLGGLSGRAIPILEHVLELDPAHPGAQWFLAAAYIFTEQPRQAIEEGNAYMSMFGLADPEILMVLAWAYHLLGELEQAQLYYDQTIRAFGDDSNVYVNLYAGKLYQDLGDSVTARQLWQQGAWMVERKLKAFPDNGRMQGILAGFWAFLGEREKLMALDIGPEEAGNSYYYIAIAHAALGDTETAVEFLRSALRMDGYSDWFPLAIDLLADDEFIESSEYAEYLQEFNAEGARRRAIY